MTFHHHHTSAAANKSPQGSASQRARRVGLAGTLTMLALVLPAGCESITGLPGLMAFLGTTQTELISRDSRGEALLPSETPTISADGRIVAFTVYAADIAGNEVFALDRDSGELERVSVATGGAHADSGGESPSISANGRYVAFQSDADTLVDDDQNARRDIFLRDRSDDVTTRVTQHTDGTEANGDCEDAAISGDGTVVVFNSFATNLVTGDDNGKPDVFVRDLKSGEFSRVNVSSDGTAQTADSARDFNATRLAINVDGRHVAFASRADILVDDDTNDATDVFVHDRDTGKTVRVSVATDGTLSDGRSFDPWLSGDGRFVVFASSATNLDSDAFRGGSAIYLHDRDADGNGVFDETFDGARSTLMIPMDSDPRGTGAASRPFLSADSSTIAYQRSFAARLPEPNAGVTYTDDDVYVYDIAAGTTQRVRADVPGAAVGTCLSNFQQVPCADSNQTSNAVLSADGRTVAFEGLLELNYVTNTSQVFAEDAE